MTLAQRSAVLIVKVGNLILDLIRVLLFTEAGRRPPKSILVLRFGAIGDFVVALPALRLLRLNFPQAKIVLLTAPTLNRKWRHRSMAAGGMIFADHLADEKICLLGPDLTAWQRLAEVRQRIRALDPDLCVFLPFSGEPLRSRFMKIVLLRFLGCRQNLRGYHADSSLRFLRRAQYDAGLYDHQIIAAIKAAGEAGMKEKEVVFELNVPEEDVSAVDALWRQCGLCEGEPPIAICPTSKETVKRWPIENFRDLGVRLLENPNVRIVLVGGGEDTPYANVLAKAWGERGVTLVGRTSVLQTAEVLRRCRLFIGVDSGPMHMAAAVGTPTIGIFASVVFPVLWKPWGEKSTIIRHSVPCEFCFTTDGVCPTGTRQCIDSIRVEEVLQAASEVLNSVRLEEMSPVAVAPAPCTHVGGE